jgi:hypothetical protein
MKKIIIIFVLIIIFISIYFFKEQFQTEKTKYLIYFGSDRCPHSNESSDSYRLFNLVKNENDKISMDNTEDIEKYNIEYVPTLLKITKNGNVEIENMNKVLEDNISNMCSEISENCINTKKNIIRQNILNT